MLSWKEAEKVFEGSFKAHGKRAAVFRLPDTAVVKALAGPKAFLPAQPADYIVVCDGEMYFAEVKTTTDRDAFHFSNIQKEQMASSRRAVAAGGIFLFFIHSGAHNQWFCVPAQLIHQTMLVEKRKHLKWSEIGKYRYEL